MALATRAIIQSALQEDGFVFLPTNGVIQSRKRKGVKIYDRMPRVLGVTPDGLSAVELSGPPDQPPAITVAGIVSEGNPRVTARNARLMTIALAVAFPTWKKSGQWLVTAIKSARTKPKATTMHSYRCVTFEYHRTNGQAILVIA